MKRLVIKTTSAFLSFIILFTGTFVLFVNADEANDVYCVSDHFSKLRYNYNGYSRYRIPQNEIGTCTHVAMSMLLSFYDFYWHDSFVPTIYSSDGTYHQMGWENGKYDSITHTVTETFTANPEAKAWINWENNGGDFQSFAAYNEIYYLQPYLINISNNELINDEIGIIGLLDLQVVDVLEEYLSRRQLGSDKGVTVHIEYGFGTIDNPNANRETLFDTIKKQINNGNPVIFFGVNDIDLLPEFIDNDDISISGHAMIAYDVIEKDGKEDILLHTGWNDYDRGTTRDDGKDNELQYYNSTTFQYLNSAVWIEIDESILPHECTYKYYDVATGNNLCACNVYYVTHPSHTHSYHKSFNSTHHYDKCICGEICSIVVHDLAYVDNQDNTHYQKCTECDYEEIVDHEYTTISSSTASGHYMECACGAISPTTEEHYRSYCVSKNQDLHYVYCECGHLIEEDTHDMVPTGKLNMSACRDCGYLRNDSNTGAVIKGEKDNPEAETE